MRERERERERERGERGQVRGHRPQRAVCFVDAVTRIRQYRDEVSGSVRFILIGAFTAGRTSRTDILMLINSYKRSVVGDYFTCG